MAIQILWQTNDFKNIKNFGIVEHSPTKRYAPPGEDEEINTMRNAVL